jgi:hypothetical protein
MFSFNLAGTVGYIYIRCEQVSPKLALDDSTSLLAGYDDSIVIMSTL